MKNNFIKKIDTNNGLISTFDGKKCNVYNDCYQNRMLIKQQLRQERENRSISTRNTTTNLGIYNYILASASIILGGLTILNLANGLIVPSLMCTTLLLTATKLKKLLTSYYKSTINNIESINKFLIEDVSYEKEDSKEIKYNYTYQKNNKELKEEELDNYNIGIQKVKK